MQEEAKTAIAGVDTTTVSNGGVSNVSPIPGTQFEPLQNIETPNTSSPYEVAVPTEGQLQSDVVAQPKIPEGQLPPTAEQVNRTHLIRRLSLATMLVIIMLVMGGMTYNRFQKSSTQTADNIKQQGVDLSQASSTDDLSVIELKGQEKKLVVGGDVIIQGTLRLHSGQYYGQMSVADLTADRDYTFPDASGTICLDTTCANTTAIQGTNNQINVVKNGDTFTLSTPQNIGTTSSPSFNTITLASAGLQGGSTICDQSNNCGFLTSSTSFVQNGNSFGATAVLGTNDNFALNFETNGVSNVSIDTSGNLFADQHVSIGNVGTFWPDVILNIEEDIDSSYTTTSVGISNYMYLQPTYTASDSYLSDSLLEVDITNSNNYSNLYGSFNRIDHDGLGVVNSATGQQIEVYSSNNDISYVTGQLIDLNHFGSNSYGQEIYVSANGDAITQAQNIATAQYLEIGDSSLSSNQINGQEIWVTGGTATLQANGSIIDIFAANGSYITDAYGQQIRLGTCSGRRGGCSATVENAYSLFIDGYIQGQRIDNNYSIYVADSGATAVSNYGIYIEAPATGVQDVGMAIEGKAAGTNYQALWIGNDSDFDNPEAGIAFGSGKDTNLYRSDIATLQTDGNLSVSQHAAIGSDSNINSGSLLSGGSFSNILSLQETFTDFSTDYIEGVTNYIILDPSTPNATFVYGIDTELKIQSGNVENIASIDGTYSSFEHDGTGTISYVSAYNGLIENNSSGTISDAYGVGVSIGNFGLGTIDNATGLASEIYNGPGTINSATGLLIYTTSNSGTLIDNYGIQVQAQSAGVNNYGITVDEAATQTLWLQGDGGGANSGIGFGSTNDTNLYRSAANTLKTDDSLEVSVDLTVLDDLTVTDVGTFEGSLVVNGDSDFNGNITVEGHIITDGSSADDTTPGSDPCAGGGGTTSVVSGNDTSGKVTITTGTGCALTGGLVQIDFATAYGSAPNVVITPADADGSTLQYYVGTSNTGEFVIDTNTTPVDSTVYEYYYHVIE